MQSPKIRIIGKLWHSKAGVDVKPRNVIAVQVQIRRPMPESMGGLGIWAFLQAWVPMGQSYPQNTFNEIGLAHQ